MELNIKTEKILTSKEKAILTAEQIVECDISLPDYYGDIVKILGCSSRVNIYSASLTGDKVVVDGRAEIKMLYVNESGKLEIYPCSYSFGRSVDAKDADEKDFVSAHVVSEQITCRAVNQRRADIRGNFTLKIEVDAICENSALTEIEDSVCHTLKTEEKGNFLKCGAVRIFTLSGSAQSIENSGKISIYRVSTLPVVNEIKTIKNKILIKGAVAVDVVYMTVDSCFESCRISVPINQICDIEGIDESMTCCVKLIVSSAEVKLSPENSGSEHKPEVTLLVNAYIYAYGKETIQLVSEAYSPKRTIVCDNDTIKCVSSIIHVNDNCTAAAKMDFSSCKATAVDDAEVKKIKYTVIGESGCVILKGNIHYGIIVTTENGEKLFFDRIADFEYRKQQENDVDDFDFSPVICPSAVNCSLGDNSVVSINTELHVDGYIINYSSHRVITSVKDAGEADNLPENSVLTIYYGCKGERLWDIAKNHNSSCECIKILNNIKDDILSEDKMLIFSAE